MDKPILIIAAMEDVELNYLKSRLENIKSINYKGFNFFEGEIQGKKVVLCVSNIGLINASMLTTIAIEQYEPLYIINEGLGGGYTKNVKKGDIVIGIDAVNITSVECIGEGDKIEDYEITTFLHNEKNKPIFQKGSAELIKQIKEKFESYKLQFRNNWKRRYLE